MKIYIAGTEMSPFVPQVTGSKGPIDTDLSKPDDTMRQLRHVNMLAEMGWHATIGLRVGIEWAYRWILAQDMADLRAS